MFTVEKIRVKNADGYDSALNLIKEQPGKWDEIGSGVYGTVYGCKDPKKDWVYKIGDVDSNGGYLAWITELQKQKKHNPYTPLIYGLRYYEGAQGSAFVVAMERLKPLRHEYYGVLSVLSNQVRGSSQLKDMQKLGIVVPKEFVQAVQMLMNARKSSGGAGWDLHGGNLMLRGRQIVVTDPLA